MTAADNPAPAPDDRTPAPDDTTPAPARDLEATWAARVRANREQAERLRETQPGGDFYAPVSALFVADPHRTDEPALAHLQAMTDPDETWLDIGAGAGRYALPLALAAKSVIAVEPSAGMRKGLRAGLAEHGIGNVRVVAGAWPESLGRLGHLPAADVSLIAHVGYDIEPIGPFLDAMEAATRRQCVAVLTDRSPASAADPFWPLVHDEERIALPALPELLEVLHARGRRTEVIRMERPPRTFDSVDALTAFLRRQLFIAEGSAKDARFRAALPDRITERDGAWTLVDRPAGSIGIVTWGPPGP